MTIDADIENGLDGHAGLTALIASQIYPVTFPDSPTFPLVLYTRISEVPFQAMGSGEPILGKATRFQFDGYAETTITAHGHSTIRLLADQMVAAILALAGDSVNIHERSILSIADLKEPDSALDRVMMDVRLVTSE